MRAVSTPRLCGDIQVSRMLQCAMCGFVGPEELLLIFRNPETISRFVPNTSMTAGQDSVDVTLGNKGGWSTAPVL